MYNDYPDDYVPMALMLTEKEKTFRILQGKCIHNGGWAYQGHHGADSMWQCNDCKEVEFI